jgi:hypothetical protein
MLPGEAKKTILGLTAAEQQPIFYGSTSTPPFSSPAYLLPPVQSKMRSSSEGMDVVLLLPVLHSSLFSALSLSLSPFVLHSSLFSKVWTLKAELLLSCRLVVS